MDPMLKLLREFINQNGFAVWDGACLNVDSVTDATLTLKPD
jgi:hypothetical protein